MIKEYLQIIEGVLFIGTALIMIAWLKKETKKSKDLIKKISILSILLGANKLLLGFSNMYFQTISILILSKLIELSGLIIFMFGLMNYLGAKE